MRDLRGDCLREGTGQLSRTISCRVAGSWFIWPLWFICFCSIFVEKLNKRDEPHKPDRPLINPPSSHTTMDQVDPLMETFPRWGFPQLTNASNRRLIGASFSGGIVDN